MIMGNLSYRWENDSIFLSEEKGIKGQKQQALG